VLLLTRTSMVDRSFALWQALYPDSYVEPQKQRQSTYWYVTGSTQDVDTRKWHDAFKVLFLTGDLALKPFYSDSNGNFWTSASVRDLTVFGYTYPELVNNDAAGVRSAINALYAPNNARFEKRSLESAPKGQITSRTEPPPANSSYGLDHTFYQLNIRAPKNGLASSFFIDFFLDGPKSEDPTTWPQDSNLMGSHAIISMKTPQDAPNITITGVVPLNPRLQQLCQEGRIADLSEGNVRSLLTGHLVWRVRLVCLSCVS
jgi:tyrosinase